MSPHEVPIGHGRQDVEAEQQWHEQPFYLESAHWTAHPLFGSRERHWLHNDVQTGRFYSELYRYLVARGRPRQAAVLLAPVGDGRDLYYVQNILSRIAAIHGVDLSAKGLAACPRPIEILKADILASGYADETFDLVICAQFLHHLHAVGFAPFLQEFRRVLKPGGTLAVLEPSNLHPVWRLMSLARRAIGNVSGLVDDERPVTPSEVTRALKQAGFGSVRVRGLLFSHVRLPATVQHLLDAVDYPMRVTPGLRAFANSLGWDLYQAARPRGRERASGREPHKGSVMAKILVTGGRGFIGTNLAAELRSRGHDVWTCDILQGEDPQHRRIDMGVYQQIDAFLARQTFDVVYHLAAEYGRWNGEDHYDNVWQTNVIGTKNLLRLQERHRFRMVFFSSAEVYGDYDRLMSEDVMDTVPIKQMNDYAISKWAGELQCLNHALMFGVEVVRVRPVGCYGPHEYYSPYRGVIPIFVYHALHNRPFKVHRGHRRIFDYVEDTCRTFANIVDCFIPGEVYNVGGREEWAIGIEELADIVLATVGARASLAEYHGEEGFTTRVKVVDFSKARRDLGHDPKLDVREGVRRYVEWARRAYGC